MAVHSGSSSFRSMRVGPMQRCIAHILGSGSTERTGDVPNGDAANGDAAAHKIQHDPG